jgi:hypothetical protein
MATAGNIRHGQDNDGLFEAPKTALCMTSHHHRTAWRMPTHHRLRGHSDTDGGVNDGSEDAT